MGLAVPSITTGLAMHVPCSVATEQLASLSLGEGSTLRTIANWIGEDRLVDGWVATATVADRIVGWAWADEEDLHVFVAPDWRRRGIGRSLATELRCLSALTDVAYHDDLSLDFWRALGIPCRFFPGDDWLIWYAMAPPYPEELPLYV